jgi:DNA-binding YbaB/EbfC family protein
MQEELQKVQKRLAEEEVTGEAGGGMVKVTLNGHHQAQRVQIDPSVFQDERELLEDLITAAINDAATRVNEKLSNSMSNATAGMRLPPGFKLPF